MRIRLLPHEERIIQIPKYYKILTEDENHKGFQYHTGLNIDPLPFNPSGDCQPRGIYFSDYVSNKGKRE